MSTEDTSVGVYVDHFYEMDPRFDDLIAGTELRDGMVVLLEESLLRGDPDRAFDPTTDPKSAKYEIARIREMNRWCTVSSFRLAPGGGSGHLAQFIGLYADGTKIPRRFDSSYYWLVKIASLPADGEVQP